jgi:hypothetical protein
MSGMDPVFQTLKEKCLSDNAKEQVGTMENLNEVWDTLVFSFDQLEKYIAEAIDPISDLRNVGYSSIQLSLSSTSCLGQSCWGQRERIY